MWQNPGTHCTNKYGASASKKWGKQEDDGAYFTNNKGAPFPDPAHSKTVGGLPLASDVLLFQSKNLERMVHPCGCGAFGYFECTQDVTGLTPISSSKVGEKTPVFVRFSTVTLGREFPDEARNPRGFAIKFYTMEGNYDIVGLNFWVNDKGNFFYIKYHFIAKHGQKQFTEDEAVRTCGEDPDYSKRDLWAAIERGEEIEWTVYVQVMDPSMTDPESLGFDPFDVTKVWPRKQFPMQEFGRLVLNKNPENFHRDVEQAAFSPGSMIPGIEDSPDPLLQFRMFFYRDAQYHRIGVNLHQIPVNCPFMVKSYSSLNFDGQMRVDANHAGNKQYAPNSFAHKFRPDASEAPYEVQDGVSSRKSHFWHEGKRNDYDQATELWARVMTDQQRQHTVTNTAKWLNRVNYPEIQVKYLAQLYNVSPDYAQGIYDKLTDADFTMTEVKKRAETAQEWYKEERFRPATKGKPSGMPPSHRVYN
ncbi:hypothetical protein H633G_06935 [Metarhizium anisopliae BRIP 53284]|nr:hypothetical protein H633G_06935 [Metarhizium anisopliae BRIP 53284]